MKQLLLLGLVSVLIFTAGCSGNKQNTSNTNCTPKSVMGQSPVYLTITDPDGLVVSDEKNEIEGAIHYTDKTWLEERKPGKYLIKVTPKPWACPDEVFSITVSPMEHGLGYTPIVIVDNVKIRDIPAKPYVYEFKTRIATNISYTGDHSCQYKGTANLSAILTDSGGKPLANKIVQFSTGYQSVSATTNSKGMATASLTLYMEIGYVQINFEGDIDYLPCYTTPVITILEPKPGSYEGLSGTWTNYTSKNGFNERGAIVIHSDNRSNIWIGAEGGVTKFDGKSFTKYTSKDGIASNESIAIANDHNNNIWIASSKGVSKFNGSAWTTYTSADGLVSDQVMAIACDSNGNIWCGTASGASKFNGANWTTYTTKDGLGNNSILAIACDNKGNTWIGTENGASRFDGKSWKTYTIADGLISNLVSAIAVDNTGNIWFGTDAGVSKFSGSTWTNYVPPEYTFNIAIEGETYGAFARSISIDKNNDVWLHTLAGYVGWISKFDGTRWNLYTTTDGLPESIIYAMEIDKDGSLWLGTDNGLYRLKQ